MLRSKKSKPLRLEKTEERDHLPNRREDPERTCIVTRAQAPVEALIRFVVAPDGSVVPDFRRRLPGRGMWVTARADCVALAEKRRLFARAHGGPVKVDPGLADRVGEGFSAAALAALSMARKAGTVTAGFAKVEAALATGDVIALIHAAEAAPDGVAKLQSAARRQPGDGKLAVIRCFTGEQLDLAFGRPNVIHAALLAGPASRNLMARVEAWLAYRGEDRPASDPAREPSELELTEFLSSGQREE
jgi:predicted RNA-binding protein YlxR (DUF448 family)